MLRITAIYPHKPQATFDWEYYVSKHVPLFEPTFEEAGVEHVAVERGVSSLAPGQPPFAICIFEATVRDGGKFRALMARHAPTLMADIPNFTNVDPIVQLNEVVPTKG